MSRVWIDLANPNLEGDGVEPSPALRELWKEAGLIWDRKENDPEFGSFVSSDYEEAFRVLAHLRGRVRTFLEWGSGLGIVTLTASSLGYEAYGIEAEPKLVEMSRELADRYFLEAHFAVGNFIPDDYQWNPDFGEEALRSGLEIEPGYDSLDMTLGDFDLVYVFPWPDEQEFCTDIMKQCGDRGAFLLIHDSREGFLLSGSGVPEGGFPSLAES